MSGGDTNETKQRRPVRLVAAIVSLALCLAASACGQDAGQLNSAPAGESDSAQPSDANVRSQSDESSNARQRDDATIASQIAQVVVAQAEAIFQSQLNEVTQLPAQGVEVPRTLSLCNDASRCLHPQTDDAVWTAPVLSIRFLGDDNNDGFVDQRSTNYSGSTDDLRGRIDDLETQNTWWSTEATRFRGYDNADARPSIGFEVTGELEFTTTPPRGEEAPGDDGVFFPDYRTILTDAGICDWVDNRGIREVWMYTHHHSDIVPATSKLSSEIGDISNSFRFDDMPRCSTPYTLYNFNFTRDVDVMLLNRALQLEAFFRFQDEAFYVSEFVGGEPPYSSPARCGSSTWAPNTVDQYVSWNEEMVTSDCASWEPGGGTQTNVSCSTWFRPAYGSSDCFPDGGVAFYTWWMQSLPGHASGVNMNDRPLPNWWEPMARLEQVQDNTSWLTPV